ncbi:alpha-L-fucosidase [Rubritalea spongiae]|uniref:alpha-L-fucosidase n=1 Tax=Rubritalea spongiae TaxID=430797 RepID=A0ABW5DXK9_9BACT
MNLTFKACATAFALLHSTPFLTAAEKEKSMDKMWGEKEALSIEAKHPSLKWFTHDKYAMFIHWGLYSEMGGVWKDKTYYGIGEWIMHMAEIPVDEYKAYASQFNPEKFDATQLVKLAKAAGMKTIVITAKHHDGFALFDSAASDFTVTKATPYKRDLMKQLADACAAEGIRLGFYYSQNQDWTEPYGGEYKGERPKDYTPDDFNIYFEKKVIPQVTELLTNYGDIAMVWFDTPGDMPKTYSERLVKLVTKHQPNCLINSRIGGGYGDYVSLGDMHIPPVRPDVGAWETVDTTNDSWSYAWYDQNWKSPKTIIERLVKVTARGGSYMLNVGPKGDGTIPAEAVTSLEESGKWLKAHSEAIYGTEGSPFDQGFSWGDITSKGNDLYLHVFDWPEEGTLRLADLGANIKSATMLHNNSKVDCSQQGSTLEVKLGSQVGRDLPIVPVIKLTLDAPAVVKNQATQVDGLTPVTLLAEMATAEGCEEKGYRWMEKFGEWKHDHFIQGWKSKDAKATWDINVLEPGQYHLSLEYSCENDAANSEWILSCGDESITFITYESGADSTKSFQPGPARQRNFKVNLGVLEIPKAGLNQLKVVPRKLIGEGIGIKGITLKPYR